MLVVNRLTEPAKIKSVVLRKDEVVVTMQDKTTAVYKRVEIK